MSYTMAICVLWKEDFCATIHFSTNDCLVVLNFKRIFKFLWVDLVKVYFFRCYVSVIFKDIERRRRR